MKKRSLEDVSQDQIYENVQKKSSDEDQDSEEASRPKNHSTASLPDYARLTGQEKTAERPPRHVKTASLPRDSLLQVSRLILHARKKMDSFRARGRDEINFPVGGEDKKVFPKSSSFTSEKKSPEGEDAAARAAACRSDNSIFKDEEHEEFGRDVKTSTPFKPTAPPMEEVEKLQQLELGGEKEDLGG